jgi:hypothetical protein
LVPSDAKVAAAVSAAVDFKNVRRDEGMEAPIWG